MKLYIEPGRGGYMYILLGHEQQNTVTGNILYHSLNMMKVG